MLPDELMARLLAQQARDDAEEGEEEPILDGPPELQHYLRRLASLPPGERMPVLLEMARVLQQMQDDVS